MQRIDTRIRRSTKLLLAGTLLGLGCSGCAFIGHSASESSNKNPNAWNKLLPGMKEDGRADKGLDGEARIANPPARTIRFDGHEMVIGNGEAILLTPDELLQQVAGLLDKGRQRSASLVALQHADAAERLLRERWALNHSDPGVRLIAQAHAYRSQCQPKDAWPALLSQAANDSAACRHFVTTRNQFTQTLQREDPSGDQVDALRTAAAAVNHPLVEIDTLRLQGLRCLLAQQPVEAQQHYGRAIEIAIASSMVDQVADLWLMASESARRGGQNDQSSAAWRQAITAQMTLMSRDGIPVDPNFWNRAEGLRPSGATWPIELGMVLGVHLQHVGCRVADPQGRTDDNRITAALWTAVGWAQYERGQPQLALVTLKKAEQTAEGNDAMFLRIAQAKCLAMLGQIPAATATLSGPLASKNDEVSTAATAALGSMKLQVGAYEQGASLLNKAISSGNPSRWPGRTHAQADLALAQLILGETEPGLDALHLAQTGFLQDGDWLALVKSLENEQRLLEHEKKTAEQTAIQRRISDLERI